MHNEISSKKFKVYVTSNGCDRRLLDTQKVSDFFKADEQEITKNPKDADYIFINTCAVSQIIEDYSVSLIKQHLPYNAKIIVHGCLPQIAPTRFKEEFSSGKIIKFDTKNLDKEMDNLFPVSKIKLSNIPDPAVPAEEHSLIFKILSRLKFDELFFLSGLAALKFKLKKINEPFHSRIKKGSYLQLGSGCSDSCTYCAIPRAVGGMKSKEINQILREYARILEKGENEFVLTADNIGLYGLEIGTDLISLFDEMNKIDNFYRKVHWTLNELHPKWAIKYKEKIVDYVKIGKIKEICIPIQSGNNRILELMKRNNKIEETLIALLEIKKANKNVVMTTDVIVGFPTETDDEFLDTIKLIVKIRFDRIMFFTYGKREGTQALNLDFDDKKNQVAINRRIRMAMKILDREKIHYIII